MTFARNCIKTKETEQAQYISMSCDIIHGRIWQSGKGQYNFFVWILDVPTNLLRVNTAFTYHFNTYKMYFKNRLLKRLDL